MIDKLISILFKWTGFREALFAEVNMYNSLTRIMKDPESMEIASAFWEEPDGWKGWTVEENKYYFCVKPFLILMLGLFIFLNYMAWLQQQTMTNG